jgi:diguanylate cyclase (GGDEF)-like protein
MIYIGFGLLWIYTSDTIVEFFIKDQNILYQINVVKGFAYVLITGNLVYSLVSRLVKVVESKENELLSSQERLFKLAYIDQRTNLSNRQKLISDLIELKKSNIHHVGLINLDIDNFTYFNDTLGHDVGDEILLYIGFVLSEYFKDYQAYQTGGDEFVILTTNLDSDDILFELFKKLQLELSNKLHDQYDIHGFTFSAGGIFVDRKSMNVDHILNNLDVARINAKAFNRGRLQMYKEDFSTTHKELIELKNNLDLAINNQEFTLFYQPQFDCKVNRIVGFEALIRWNKDGENIPPDKFIPFAETSKQIIPIGHWVFEEVFRTMKLHKESIKNRFTFSINLYPIQVTDYHLPENIISLITKYEINPSLIELEITETVLMDYNQDIIKKFDPLRKMGVKIALDDFGVGYSNLSYFHNIDFNTLKIDREFIKNINDSNSKKKSILQGISTIGQVVAENIIAEGVET